MNVYSDPEPLDYTGTRLFAGWTQETEPHDLSGDNAVGHEVPFWRKNQAYKLLKEFGLTTEGAMTVVGQMSHAIQRDEPMSAFQAARAYGVDITGIYRVYAVLLSGPRPKRPAPAQPASAVDAQTTASEAPRGPVAAPAAATPAPTVQGTLESAGPCLVLLELKGYTTLRHGGAIGRHRQHEIYLNGIRMRCLTEDAAAGNYQTGHMYDQWVQAEVLKFETALGCKHIKAKVRT